MAAWQEQALCRDSDDPDLWFEREVNQAKAVCMSCPVRLECLDDALHNDEYGVWGGMTRDERDRMKRRLGIKTKRIKAADEVLYGCGTDAGATRHRRRGEPVCEPCREAAAIALRRRKDRRMRR